MDGLLRGERVKVAVLGLVLAAVAAGCGGATDELKVTQSSLRPGEITLVVHNGSHESARLAQVIVNDAFVDFSTSSRTVTPDDVEALVVFYPWIEGESYEVRLMTSTGSTVDYEIEDAEAS
jgi:ZIP family zinc transporter